MNVKRMRLAIRALRELRPTDTCRFDMHSWIVQIPVFSECSDPRVDLPVSCGTAACALGSLALDPRFQRLGLRPRGTFVDTDTVRSTFLQLRTERSRLDGVLFSKGFRPEKYGHSYSVGYTSRRGREYNGLEAGRKLLGLSSREAYALFIPPCYGSHPSPITPEQVADQMERALRKYLRARKKRA